MAVADLADPLEVSRRRREAAARVLDRLHEDGSDGVLALSDDGPFDLVGRPDTEGLDVVAVLGRSVEVGVGDLDGARTSGSNIFFSSGMPSATGHHRRPVVRDVAADELGAVGLADVAEVLA